MDENLDLSKNIELNQALQEFEAKSASEQIPQAPEALKTSEIPKIVELAMKWFKVEQKQAEYILLGFVVLAIIVSLFLFFGGSLGKSPDKKALEQMLIIHPELIKR